MLKQFKLGLSFMPYTVLAKFKGKIIDLNKLIVITIIAQRQPYNDHCVLPEYPLGQGFGG